MSGGGKGGDSRSATAERLAELAPKALELIAGELDTEKRQQRGIRTRLLTAKWVIERVLELPLPEAGSGSDDKPAVVKQLTPEAAVHELRKRLSGGSNG